MEERRTVTTAEPGPAKFIIGGATWNAALAVTASLSHAIAAGPTRRRSRDCNDLASEDRSARAPSLSEGERAFLPASWKKRDRHTRFEGRWCYWANKRDGSFRRRNSNYRTAWKSNKGEMK